MTPRASPRHPASRFLGADLAEQAAAVRRRAPVPSAVVGPNETVALALRAVRGRQRRSVERFAAAYGIEGALIRRIEAGWVAGTDMPVVLRVLTPVEAVSDRLEQPQLSTSASASASASAWLRAQR